MTTGDHRVGSAVARARALVHTARMDLLDAEVYLDELERVLHADRLRRVTAELADFDATGLRANAAASAAEEYRADGALSGEDYVPGGDAA